MSNFAFLTSSYPFSKQKYSNNINICSTKFSKSIPKWKASLVTIAGATGGVGQLVIKRLLDSIKNQDDLTTISTQSSYNNIKLTQVRALVRDIPTAQEILPSSNPALTFQQVESTQYAKKEQLQQALKGTSILIISTGVPAFPSKSWQNGNNPKAVYEIGIKRLIDSVDMNTIKRIIIVSSVGTRRQKQFPFFILNAFGTLDAKAKADNYLKQQAQKMGYSYAIIRPGRLVGGPHTNIGMLKSEPKPTHLAIQVAKGDTLSGDISRATVADTIVIASRWNLNCDLDFCIVHKKGPSPGMESWEQLLTSVEKNRESLEDVAVSQA